MFKDRNQEILIMKQKFADIGGNRHQPECRTNYLDGIVYAENNDRIKGKILLDWEP
jgi:hypothetical protein